MLGYAPGFIRGDISVLHQAFLRWRIDPRRHTNGHYAPGSGGAGIASGVHFVVAKVGIA
jgi:hypothetical protein